MQVNEFNEQLVGPSYKLFVDDEAGVDLAREVGLSVGNKIFHENDANHIIEGIMNMEAYFYHMRGAALTALTDRLRDYYGALTAITIDTDNAVGVQLTDGQTLPLPGHTSPALNELQTKLQPAEGSDNPRLCLEMIQQVVRLMQVMGMTKLQVRDDS